jgi:hypothetical protein
VNYFSVQKDTKNKIGSKKSHLNQWNSQAD